MKILRILIPVLVLLAVGLWLFYGFADGFAKSGSQEVISPGETSLQQVLQHRYTQGDTLPLFDKELVFFLPKAIPGFVQTETKGSTFHARRTAFSEVRRVFTDKNQDFLVVHLADYVADSSGFRYHWQQYQSQQTGSLTLPVSAPPFSFAWKQRDPANPDLQVWQACLGYRFHWIVRGSNENAVRIAFEVLDWQGLRIHSPSSLPSL